MSIKDSVLLQWAEICSKCYKEKIPVKQIQDPENEFHC